MRPRKRFGQHFLEPLWADRLVAAIEPQPGDRFLEIGPGPGALTLRLAPRVAHLTAVEVDRDLAALLAPQLPGNVELLVADFLEADLSSVLDRGPLRVAGNLPYNISTPILFRLIELSQLPPSQQTSAPADHRTSGPVAQPTSGPTDQRTSAPADQRISAATDQPTSGPAAQRIRDATLMLQREVAERLEAGPGSGDYGVLSISVQLHADVRRVLSLPPGAFRPAPKVHSAVVRLTFRPPRTAPRDGRVFEGMVRSVFTQRRKTLANALRAFAEVRGLRAPAVLEAAGIDSGRRPETLDLDELVRLADRFPDHANG